MRLHDDVGIMVRAVQMVLYVLLTSDDCIGDDIIVLTDIPLVILTRW